MKFTAAITALSIFGSALTVSAADFHQPEGWATCTSIHSAGDFNMNGGGEGSLVVLKYDGTDMRQVILEAIKNHEVIVFDGSEGDFVMPAYISLQSLQNRTLIGVNGACFRTKFTVTQDIRDLLDALDVNSLSQNSEDNLGGTLSNGIQVAEQRELTVRQALIDHFGDPKEPYRNSGVFNLYGCSNIILRNIDFVGPGSIDVGGADLVTVNGCDHIWIDHCRFTDGMDGNVDIINNSDFVTLTDDHFRYTSRSYNHPLSNLNSGYEITDGSPQKNNISWIRCFWDEGCTGRMPLSGYGIHHILNCFWDCTGGTCVDAHYLSQNLIEQSYFSNKVKRALAVRDDNVTYDWRGSIWQSHASPKSTAAINVPYTCPVENVMDVPSKIRSEAGPKLEYSYTRTFSAAPAMLDFGKVYQNNPVESRINISAFGDNVPENATLTAPQGILLSFEPDGEYLSSLYIEATDANLIQATVYVRAWFGQGGHAETAIEVTAPGQSFSIPVKADVIAMEGEGIETTLIWPFDNGVSSNVDAFISKPEAFSAASFSMGDKIQLHSGKFISNSSFTLFNPTEDILRVVDGDCRITFDVVTASGYTFIPQKLKFKAARMGTDMCYVDIECGRNPESMQKLLTAFQPVRSSDSPYYSEVELPLNNLGIGNSLTVNLYLYFLTANKQLALSDFSVEGVTYAVDSSIEVIGQDEQSAITEYFDLMGRKIMKPQAGVLYVMRRGMEKPRLILYP